MAREDVNIKVSANVAEAIRLWKAMEAGPEGMARELDAMGAKGKKAAGGMAAELDKIVGKWTSIGAAISAAKQLLDAFMRSQQEAAERTAGSTRTADQMGRELYQLTDGRRPLEQIQRDFIQTAARRGSTLDATRDVYAALLGAGYDYSTVSKGGADVVLQGLSATNATGKNVDAKQLVDAITAHLEATGQSRSVDSLRGALMATQGLFAATKLEISDLQNLAPRASNIFSATGLQNEQIALMSILKDVTSGDVGATAMQAAITRLIAPRGRSLDALAEMGLRPEDVDFNGENFAQVQRLLASRFEAAGPNAARLRAQLFGLEGLAAGNVLFSTQGVQRYQERLGMMNDPESFYSSAAVMEGSLRGKAASAEARSVLANIDPDYVDPAIARQAMQTWMEENKVSSLGRFSAEKSFDVVNWATSGEEAERAVYAGMRQIGYSQYTREIVDQARAETIRVRVELVDQNQAAIPHRSEVNNLSRPQREQPRGGR